MKVTNIDLAVLEKLANANQLSDEFDALASNVSNPLIAEEMKVMRAEQERMSARAAAQQVLNQLKASNEEIESDRRHLATIRRAEANLKNKIQITAVITEYGNLTNDYRPLATLLSNKALDSNKVLEMHLLDKAALDKAKKAVSDRLSKKQNNAAEKPAAKKPAVNKPSAKNTVGK